MIVLSKEKVIIEVRRIVRAGLLSREARLMAGLDRSLLRARSMLTP